MVIAIDFDGVIHNPADKVEGRRMGRPHRGAKEALTLLKSRGDTVIIHSCNRANVIADWMSYYEIPYSTIWQTEGKPVADVYLDDRAVHFYNWDQALGEIL